MGNKWTSARPTKNVKAAEKHVLKISVYLSSRAALILESIYLFYCCNEYYNINNTSAAIATTPTAAATATVARKTISSSDKNSLKQLALVWSLC